MPDQKNILIAIALSLAILFGFEFLWPGNKHPAPPATAVSDQATPPAPPAVSTDGVVAPGTVSPVAAPVAVDRSKVIAGSPRVAITTPQLSGTLSLTGSRLDDLTLRNYRESTDPQSPNITLLSPRGSEQPYYAEFGWVAADRAIGVPASDTVWQADGDTLTPEKPLMLLWSNGQGLVFKRVVSVDKDFMFTFTDSVENTGSTPVTLYPYGLVSRGYTPHTEDFYILHEGPLGVIDGTLKEFKYKKLKEEKEFRADSKGGWIGITDKYWLTAIDLDNERTSRAHYQYTGAGSSDRYQVDYLGEGRVVAPGASIAAKTDFFAGAKQVTLLDHYAEAYKIDRFDLAIDFGWFYFLTKPFFYALQFLHGVLGNFGLAIIAFTVVLRGLMFPLANKSFKSMSGMKKLQPELKKLQERFADDRQRLNQEMMTLYKKEGVNPVSGCLPMLLQIPIFFSLYKVLFVSIEMRQAPFYGWIHDLSAPDPTSLFNLFGLIAWTPPHFLHIGIWPLLMGVTMLLQQKLNPAPADPIQARIMMFLPVIFTVMLANFPAGLVIYWAWSNILGITQQWIIMRKMGVSA